MEFEAHAPLIWRLLTKYHDVPMDFADACLVRMTELHADCTLWTTDGDFRVYRRHGRQTIPLLTRQRRSQFHYIFASTRSWNYCSIKTDARKVRVGVRHLNRRVT